MANLLIEIRENGKFPAFPLTTSFTRKRRHSRSSDSRQMPDRTIYGLMVDGLVLLWMTDQLQ
jgi:hypothetical protein